MHSFTHDQVTMLFDGDGQSDVQLVRECTGTCVMLHSDSILAFADKLRAAREPEDEDEYEGVLSFVKEPDSYVPTYTLDQVVLRAAQWMVAHYGQRYTLDVLAEDALDAVKAHCRSGEYTTAHL